MHRQCSLTSILSLCVGLYVDSFVLPLFPFITSHALSICMFSDTLSASPCLLEVGMVLEWSWLGVLFYWHGWHICVAMAAGAAAYQPAVKAVTVRSVLTSACDLGWGLLGVGKTDQKSCFLRHPRTVLFAFVSLKSNFFEAASSGFMETKARRLKQNDLSDPVNH